MRVKLLPAAAAAFCLLCDEIPMAAETAETIPAPTASAEVESANVTGNYSERTGANTSEQEKKAALYDRIEDLPEEISDEALQLVDMRDGDAAVLYNIGLLSENVPELLNEYPVGYAIKDGYEEPGAVIVFNYSGKHHAYVLNEEQVVTDEMKNEFIEYILGLYDEGALSYESAGTDTYSVTFDTYYTDTYIEAGNIAHTGSFGTRTTFDVGRRLTSAESDGDLYDIVTFHKVKPYGWTAYATTRYSTGINITASSDFIYYAIPDAEIELNESRAYSFSVGYPLSISFDFVWEGGSGTKMTARSRDFQHDIVFTNSQGVFGPGENGEFTYKTLTQIKALKNKTFSFYYNEVMYNAIAGNQTDMHEYGDQWKVVSPYFSSGAGAESSGVYLWEGRDYSCVFDPDFYLSNYADLQAAFSGNPAGAFNHFITNGMSEARQAIATFNVNTYKARYSNLQAAFGDNMILYYQHYIDYGRAEGRSGI